MLSTQSLPFPDPAVLEEAVINLLLSAPPPNPHSSSLPLSPLPRAGKGDQALWVGGWEPYGAGGTVGRMRWQSSGSGLTREWTEVLDRSCGRARAAGLGTRRPLRVHVRPQSAVPPAGSVSGSRSLLGAGSVHAASLCPSLHALWPEQWYIR